MRASQAAILALLWVVPVLLGGCANKRTPPADSPEEAYLQLLAACEAADGALLFDALDTPTQWAVETVHGAQQKMRLAVAQAYPPDERARAEAQIPAAAEESLERPRRYLKRLAETGEVLADARKRLYAGTGQPVGSVHKKEGTADVWREGGSIFHFSRDDQGRWGWAEQRELWERNKERALHDLDTIQQNATLYRQARKAPAPTAPGAPTPSAKGSP